MWTSQKRQRVARACDFCKRRKKQCSGEHPCRACQKRSEACTFAAHPSNQNQFSRPSVSVSSDCPPTENRRIEETSDDPLHHKASTAGDLRDPQPYDPPLEDLLEDATPIQNPGRMLQDNGGRLVYLGDSATLSFLQTVRKLVETKLGPSPFTKDVHRHKILEATTANSDAIRLNFALPGIEITRYLVGSFFESTTGLCDIYDRNGFENQVIQTYKRPLDTDPKWLCQLNLVLAVGLQMRFDRPAAKSTANKTLDQMEELDADRAEKFYYSSRKLYDPTEDVDAGGIETLQSLLLILLYMLASSRRNSAWRYLGMAVNLAYALGIHKEETLPMFDSFHQCRRQNLWQTVYIFDCFLATSLGRPNHISYETASELCCSKKIHNNPDSSDKNGFHFATRASIILGQILSRVYHKRKASRSVAHQLSICFNEWSQQLPTELQWRSMSRMTYSTVVINRLHVNLIWFHGIILLTRPFFLYQITRQLKIVQGNAQSDTVAPPREEHAPEEAYNFESACVRAALFSITVIDDAFNAKFLSRRNPFVIYWLFSAALVVLTNKFSPVHQDADETSTIKTALKIMRFCGEADPQARRYQTILESFFEVLQQSERENRGPNRNARATDIFGMVFDDEPAGSSRNGFYTRNHDRTLGSSSMQVFSTESQPMREVANEKGVLDPTSTISEGNHEPTSRAEEYIDGRNEITHDVDIWWSQSQDIFDVFGDIQVPLYGLMGADMV